MQRLGKRMAMAPHSSTLAWKIPWTEEPGRLQHGVAKSRTRLKRLSSSSSKESSSSDFCDWTWLVSSVLRGEGRVGFNPASLDSKEIKPVNPEGNQPWLFIGKTDAEAEAPILCPPDAKSQLNGKDPDAEKDWRQKEKGATDNQMVAVKCSTTELYTLMRRLDGLTDSMDMSLSKLQEIVKDKKACPTAVHGVTKSQTWLHDWTKTLIPLGLKWGYRLSCSRTV